MGAPDGRGHRFVALYATPGRMEVEFFARRWLGTLPVVGQEDGRDVRMSTLRERAPTAHPLTPREEQVVELVAQDLPNRQIAERLGLTEFSVRNIVFRAGLKIPGDLPLRQRIRHWYNGGQAFREATR
jgi:hypothetical protein